VGETSRLAGTRSVRIAHQDSHEREHDPQASRTLPQGTAKDQPTIAPVGVDAPMEFEPELQSEISRVRTALEDAITNKKFVRLRWRNGDYLTFYPLGEQKGDKSNKLETSAMNIGSR
jgi:hypothetical protein